MKSVVICGSGRFKPEILKFASDLEKLGVIVYAPFQNRGMDDSQKVAEDYKKYAALGLIHDHFYKIKMADVVFIYNKDGYAGVSTTLEIGCAVALGKPIYTLSDQDPELCRAALFRGIIKTAKEMAKLLN